MPEGKLRLQIDVPISTCNALKNIYGAHLSKPISDILGEWVMKNTGKSNNGTAAPGSEDKSVTELIIDAIHESGIDIEGIRRCGGYYKYEDTIAVQKAAKTPAPLDMVADVMDEFFRGK